MTKPRRINLALQGGGSHGAFTWGVLDGLLEQPSVEFGWISGTSAGAVNAVALASGMATGGRDGARATLARVWTSIVDAGTPDIVKLNPLLAAQWEAMSRNGAFAHLTAMLSPYEFNPLGINPLRTILAAELDFERLQAAKGPELLLAATDIETGRARLFRRKETTLDVIIASACLPTLHHAVEIGDRAYWDGGFSANPELITVAAESPVADTLIVQLAPLVREQRPTTAREITAHVAHLTFNRPYIDQLTRIAERQSRSRRFGMLAGLAKRMGRQGRIATHRFHLIDAGRHTAHLPAGSQGKADEQATTRLFHAGRSEAAKWLDRHGDDIGRRDTADIAKRIGLGR